jgi:hypothetical protein
VCLICDRVTTLIFLTGSNPRTTKQKQKPTKQTENKEFAFLTQTDVQVRKFRTGHYEELGFSYLPTSLLTSPLIVAHISLK